MKKILLMTFLIAVVISTSQAEAKSHVWSSGVLPDYLAYVWDPLHAGWGLGLYDINASVTRNAYMYRNSIAINDGAVVNVGDTISFTAPVMNSDISWFASGYSVDSPYGKWVNNAGFPGSISTLITTLPAYKIYSEFSVNPSAITFTHTGSTASLSCNSNGSSCVVNSSGSILTQVNYSSTYGKFYYRYEYSGGQIGQATIFQTTPMRRILNYSSANQAGWYHPVDSSDYVVNVPTQVINFSITAVGGNNPPFIPVLTPDATCTVGQVFSLTVRGIDPDSDNIRYAIDWDNNGSVDQYLPSSGYVNSNTSQTVSQAIAIPGVYSYKVRTEDSKGGVSPWTPVQATTCVNPTYVCTGTIPVNAVVCAGDSTGLSINTSRTVVNSCTVAKCEYTCSSGYIKNGNSCIPTQCNDGVDNADAEDTLVDLSDPGCANIDDTDETNLPPTADISATDCSIPAGGASCITTVTWSSSNATMRSIRHNGVQFSTVASSASGINRTATYGSHIFAFYNNGALLKTDTINAACVSGTSWDGDSCEVVSVANLSANIPNTVSSAIVGSDITLTSNVQNIGTAAAGPYNIRFYIDNNNDGNADYSYVQTREVSNTAASASQSESVTWTIPTTAPAGTWRVGYYADTDNEVAESGIDGPWQNWSGWRSFTVTNPPSVTFDVSGCTIAINQSQCNGNVNWIFSNVQAPENYLIKNITTGLTYGTTITSGGTIQKPLQYGVNTITASANGVSDTKTVNVVCDESTVWYDNICSPSPTLSITATPKLIRSGDTTDVLVSVNSAHVLNCSLHNATSDNPKIFTHNGTTVANESYPFTTKNISATQIVTVTCVDTATNLSSTAEVRIEVVPKVQEI